MSGPTPAELLAQAEAELAEQYDYEARCCPGTQTAVHARRFVLSAEAKVVRLRRRVQRTEPTAAGEQGMLPGAGARQVPPEPIRRPELLPDGELFRSDGSPAEPPAEPEPELFDDPEG